MNMLVKITEDREIYRNIKKILENNGIVAIPTDTGYGIVVDGTKSEAIERLNILKKIEGKPFTIFLAKSQLDHYTIVVKRKIIDYFVPGPITVILKKKLDVPLYLDGDKVCIRIPDTNFVTELLNYYGRPLAGMSTDILGEPVLNNPYEIAQRFPEIELVIDNGTLTHNPSTVLDLTTSIPTVKIKGIIPILEIEKVYGRIIKLDPAIKFNLLFICSGNSCRSPMAVGIIKRMLDDKFVQVNSAGTAAIDGLAASINAQEVVKEFGGDISSHKTKYLTKELVDDADLILVMEYKHYETVLELSPRSAVKTFLLKEYKRRAKDNEVLDPVGRDIEVYRDTALGMYPSLKFVAREIKKRFTEA